MLPNDEWGTRYKSWPTLTDMRKLGRLVVFNNNGINEFPYNRLDMWYDVRENRYGQKGLDTKVRHKLDFYWLIPIKSSNLMMTLI